MKFDCIVLNKQIMVRLGLKSVYRNDKSASFRLAKHKPAHSCRLLTLQKLRLASRRGIIVREIQTEECRLCMRGGGGVLICMRPAVRARVMIGLPSYPRLSPALDGDLKRRLPHASLGYNIK